MSHVGIGIAIELEKTQPLYTQRYLFHDKIIRGYIQYLGTSFPNQKLVMSKLWNDNRSLLTKNICVLENYENCVQIDLRRKVFLRLSLMISAGLSLHDEIAIYWDL